MKAVLFAFVRVLNHRFERPVSMRVRGAELGKPQVMRIRRLSTERIDAVKSGAVSFFRSSSTTRCDILPYLLIRSVWLGKYRWVP